MSNLEPLFDMLNSGMLCDCKRVKMIETSFGYELILKHKKNCKGIKPIKKLLGVK